MTDRKTDQQVLIDALKRKHQELRETQETLREIQDHNFYRFLSTRPEPANGDTYEGSANDGFQEILYNMKVIQNLLNDKSLRHINALAEIEKIVHESLMVYGHLYEELDQEDQEIEFVEAQFFGAGDDRNYVLVHSEEQSNDYAVRGYCGSNYETENIKTAKELVGSRAGELLKAEGGAVRVYELNRPIFDLVTHLVSASYVKDGKRHKAKLGIEFKDGLKATWAVDEALLDQYTRYHDQQ